MASAVGDVRINYGGVEIIAGRAEYNSNTRDVIARENVTVLKDGQVFRGENVTYNFETQELKANNLRSGLPPIFYKTADLKANLSDKDEETGQLHRIDGTQTYFTTHDSNNPNYHLTSKSLTIYPGDRVVMRNVKVYVGKTPVFWLPLFVQPLDNEQGYFFRPGLLQPVGRLPPQSIRRDVWRPHAGQIPPRPAQHARRGGRRRPQVPALPRQEVLRQAHLLLRLRHRSRRGLRHGEPRPLHPG